MEKKLNILHFPEWYPHNEDDMEGVFIQKHVAAIQMLHNCCVLFCKGRFQKKLITLDYTIENNVPTYRVYYKKKITRVAIIDTFIRKALYVWAVKKGLKKIHKEQFKEDLLHLHVADRNSMYVNKFYNKPYVLTEHWTRYGKIKRQDLNPSLFKKTIFKKAKGVSVVSQSLKEDLNFLGIKNTCVIPNVVDENIFSYKAVKKEHIKRLIHVSEFKDEHKNITGILNSIHELIKKRTDFKLTLVGYGVDLPLIKQRIESLNLQPYIELKGKLYPEELAKQYQLNDLFVLNSKYETFAVVIIEALLCGCPVVSTKVGVAEELINLENGVLVDDNLTESLDFVLSNEYDRAKIASNVKGKFDKNTVSKLFSSFYHSSLGRQC